MRGAAVVILLMMSMAAWLLYVMSRHGGIIIRINFNDAFLGVGL